MGNPKGKKAQARVRKQQKLRRDRVASLAYQSPHQRDANKVETCRFQMWTPYWSDYKLCRRGVAHSPLAKFLSDGYGTTQAENCMKLIQLYIAFWAKTGDEVPSLMLDYYDYY